MDQLMRAFYDHRFETYFRSKRGKDFQDLFADIMAHRYGTSFHRVCPWGQQGDWKCDGYLKSEEMLFACYAPREMKDTKTARKIDEDFSGAVAQWKKYMQKWVFVHNDPEGLSPRVTQKLLELGRRCPDIDVRHWGIIEVKSKCLELQQSDLEEILGKAPDKKAMMNTGMEELVPVLKTIEDMPPEGQQDLSQPSADKIEHNMLSESVRSLLKAGMTKAPLVRRYFQSNSSPEKRDSIAKAFKRRYQEFRNANLPPDEIFAKLHEHVGGEAQSAPKRLCAEFAVLSHFFETCDIFENAPSEDGE